MPFNGLTDWLTRGKQPYKNLDEQRRENEKAQARAKHELIGRIVIAVFAVLIVLAEYVPSSLPNSRDEALLITVLPIAAVFLTAALSIALGIFIIRRRRRQAEMDSSAAARSYSWNEESAKSEERYTAHTSSSRDYSAAVDSWDIKDPKPPWEL